jgi:hypothetical protein
MQVQGLSLNILRLCLKKKKDLELRCGCATDFSHPHLCWFCVSSKLGEPYSGLSYYPALFWNSSCALLPLCDLAFSIEYEVLEGRDHVWLIFVFSGPSIGLDMQ